jgi:hypothetical protein
MNLRGLVPIGLSKPSVNEIGNKQGIHNMKELNIEEMTSVRGGQTLAFDISRSFNGSNVAAIVSAGNVAEALPTNLSSGGTVTQAAVAQAGNQAVQLTQSPF